MELKGLKLKEIIEYSDSGKLVLPDFQRELEWKPEDQKRLLASFLVSLPIGSLLILNGSCEDFAAKRLCFCNEDDVNPKEECLYLLDGQQRASTLKSIFYDFFRDNNWINNYNKLYMKLTYRWFIKVVPDTDEEDIFGWNDLKFNDLSKYEPGQLLELIHFKKIHKTKAQDWYNPSYVAKDKEENVLSGNRKKNKIAQFAASEGLVPLNMLYDSLFSPEKTLHQYVLEKIAQDRVAELKAEVRDSKRDICDLLCTVDPEINEHVEDNDQTSIEFAWSTLSAQWSQSILDMLKKLLDQEIPTIELPSNEISRAVATFESINRGGTPLDIFDLVVAKAARDKSIESLSQRITNLLKKELDLPDSIWGNNKGDRVTKWYSVNIGTLDRDKISDVIKNQYLNLLSIVCLCKNVDEIKTDKVKSKNTLNLSNTDINSKTEEVINALIRACAFLQFRCGIVNISDLPYKLMLLPIAYSLIDDFVWNDKIKLDKIEYWYWSSLFGGAYRDRQNDQCAKDIRELHLWINECNYNPFINRFEKILKEEAYSSKDILLRNDKDHEIPTAIHKGILQFILSGQPKDFLSEDIRLNPWDLGISKEVCIEGKNVVLKVEDHHICPLSNVTKIGESTKNLRGNKQHILNSILNRTYISSYANALISDKSPEKYFEYVSEFAQWGHCIPTPVASKFKKMEGEDDLSYYTRILEERYEELNKNIKLELSSLM